MKFFLQHKTCKGIAFEFTKMPIAGEIITMEMVKMKRGQGVNKEILCDKCGGIVYVDNLDYQYLVKTELPKDF